MRQASCAVIICLLSSFAAHTQIQASVVDVSQQQPITENGQLFNFAFHSLPLSDGNGGQFTITLDGDYSPRSYPPLSEGAKVTFDVASVNLLLFNGGGNGIASNTIAGLSLDSVSGIGSGGNDVTLHGCSTSVAHCSTQFWRTIASLSTYKTLVT